MTILRLLIGAIILFTGRQLYWFFVGAAGFVLGLTLATRFFSAQPEWLVILIALVIGFVGALLAVFVQRLAIGVAGFIAGGYVLTTLLALVNVNLGRLEWVIFIIGGIIGAVLVAVLFDWALIALSSLAGATLILRSLDVGAAIGVLIFLGLLVVGVAVQAAQMRRTTSRAQSSST